MCFSPEADLAAGVVVTVVGIDAIRRARTPKELPLAALPLLLGIHQLVEAFVWWGLAGQVSSRVGHAATWLYLAVAFALPFWVPFAVRGVEESRRRRTIITAFVAVGLVASSVLLGSIVFGPIDASVEGHHIAYSLSIPGGATISILYVVATCGALLMASDRWIRDFGLSNLFAVGLLAWLTVGGLTSLWCVWAAFTSVAIDLYLRDGERRAHLITT
jgi:quinol-cytochrome oxidoreductase complex cytochrome b subunit